MSKMRFLLPCLAAAGLFVAQADAQNVRLSSVVFEGNTANGNAVIHVEQFVTVLNTPQTFAGTQVDLPCAPAGWLNTDIDTLGTGQPTSLGGVAYLFPGGLGPVNLPNCRAAATPAIGGPSVTLQPGDTRWLATFTYQADDCIPPGNTLFPFEAYSEPPIAADQTKLRETSAILIAFVRVEPTVNVPAAQCCDASGACISDNTNEFCCELIAGNKGTVGKTCADQCACSTNADCDDNNVCNGAETCNVGTGECIPGTPLNCDDSNPCTLDSCDPIAGCQHDGPANNGLPCGSGANTECDNPDTCLNGACVPNFEPAGFACGDAGDTECDNPDSCNGSGTCLTNNVANGTVCTDDGIACTFDRCETGACVHPPKPNGESCNDGLGCTVNDVCTDGNCAGGPKNCDDGLFCTNDTCLEPNGDCVNTEIPGCTENPELTLEPVKDENDANCHDAGEEVCVNVVFGGTPPSLLIGGGQFRVEYDPTCLDFVSAAPGPIVWTNELLEVIDEVNGVIFYAVGSPIGAPIKGTNLPGVMATFCFDKVGTCNECNLCLTDLNPQHTYLVSVKGVQVDPADLGCSKTIYDDGLLTVNCPGDKDVNADCMLTTATVTWPAIQFVDECEGLLEKVCTCEQIEGEDMGDCTYLAEAGGVFPQGRFVFHCDAADDKCNEPAACDWTVKVSDEQTLDVKLQLSPVVIGDAFTRCICFELFSSCTPLVMEEICETIEFGGPFEFDGQATASVKVPKGKYVCIQVRDRQHSLRSTDSATFDCVGSVYTANFKGDPFFGGNWLIQGNLNRDRLIDILDFGTFLGQLNQNPNPGPDKACEDGDGAGLTHADFNGDGIVDIADFTFIQVNFGLHDKADCCHPATAADPVALTEVSVKQLREMGLGDLAVADLNNDGFVNTDDMSLFLQGVRPKAAKGTRGNTTRIGSVK